MAHLMNFIRGLAVFGGVAILGVSCFALPFWFSIWISGGALWGLPVCVVLMVGMVGGVSSVALGILESESAP